MTPGRAGKGGGGGRPAARRRPARRDSGRTPDAMDRLRRAIDALDVKLVDQLNRRAEHAIAIGRIKQERRLAIYQPDREEQVLGNVQAHNSGPLHDSALKRLFERIIDESRRLERLAVPRDQDDRPGDDPGQPSPDNGTD